MVPEVWDRTDYFSVSEEIRRVVSTLLLLSAVFLIGPSSWESRTM